MAASCHSHSRIVPCRLEGHVDVAIVCRAGALQRGVKVNAEGDEVLRSVMAQQSRSEGRRRHGVDGSGGRGKALTLACVCPFSFSS